MSVGKGLLFHEGDFEGQVISGQFDTFYRGTLEDATNADSVTIPNGSFVIFSDTVEGSIILPTTALVGGGSEFIGVVTAMSYNEKPNIADANGVVGIPVNRPATYMIRGVVGVTAETDINRGDPIFIRTADEASPGAFDRIGRIRFDASGGNAAALPPGRGLILRDVLAGEVARVAINFSPTLL